MDQEVEGVVDELETDAAGEEDETVARYDVSYVAHACHTGNTAVC